MMELRNLSDDELLGLFGQENIAAFEEIYNRYWLKLYSAAFKRLKEREPAREMVQDLFTSLWVNRAQLHIHTTLQGYLFSSVKYSVLNYKRAEAVRNAYSEARVLVNEGFDNSTEEYISYKELKETFDAGVTQLPPKCRSVFELSRNQYKSNKEIAQLLGISEKTVENHITKALRSLRLNMDAVSIAAFLFINHFRG